MSNQNMLNWLKFATGVTILGAFLISLVKYLFFAEHTQDDEYSRRELIGLIINAVMLIIGYFFGSSKSSQEKTDAMIANNETKKSTK